MIIRKTVPVALTLFAGVNLFIACLPSDRAAVQENIENAAAVAQYKVLLAECRSRGRDAGSYFVYEQCAAALDQDLCQRSALRCEDGGAR